MTNMSNLPSDLVEEIFSRVPVTSMRKVRFACKTWNTLSNDESFTKKHLDQAAVTSAMAGEFMAIGTIDFTLCLMCFNFHGIHNDIKCMAKLVSLNVLEKLDITGVSQCDGLLLCTTEDYTRLVVWNPYSGQTRWICIDPRSVPQPHKYDYALGYGKSTLCHSYKILRYAYDHENFVLGIYELNSNSWRVLDDTPASDIWFNNRNGLSLKGNTYWWASDIKLGEAVSDFFVCFDFTTESFGPRLPLPFSSFYLDPDHAVTLTSVREEQLAALFLDYYILEIEVWITTKIEPNTVSWSKFLAVDMSPVTGFRVSHRKSFVIDEEKRAAVVFDELYLRNTTPYIAYIIGENGSVEKLVKTYTKGGMYACSYVPSSAKIVNQPTA